MSGVAVSAVPTTLLDRAQGLRDRLLASPRFRRWAVTFPPTRPVARRRTQALFDLCAGFVYSQVLLACVRLHVFDTLAAGPLSVAVLADRIGLTLDATSRLLDAAVPLRLLRRRGPGRVGLGPLGAALVGNEAVTAMIEHHGLLYADLADPVALLRGEALPTKLAGYWPYAEAAGRAALQPGQVAGYSKLMAASQMLIADEVLSAYRMGRHRCLMDVGGGDGAFISAAAARAPGLKTVLFDLPPVADRARARFDAEGLRDATAVGGDFFTDPWPAGADVITLIRVLHDHDDDAALALLREARRALPRSGTLVLAEPMAATPGAESVGAYFAFYLLAMGSGRPRTFPEIERLLRTAGFLLVEQVRTATPSLVRVVIAGQRAGTSHA